MTLLPAAEAARTSLIRSSRAPLCRDRRESVADWRGLVCRRQPGVLVFAEDLSEEVMVCDQVRRLDYRYDRVATPPARGFLRHIYRRRL
ncbi:MAG: hypothetical protein IPK26_20170 [Planctomycetes bacterium]|nr:hypothetical protein [Planctomycetota bacterium]